MAVLRASIHPSDLYTIPSKHCSQCNKNAYASVVLYKSSAPQGTATMNTGEPVWINATARVDSKVLYMERPGVLNCVLISDI